LALLLLLCVTAAGWAAEPAPATVVLQLPPSMSPESVKSLISDLAAKGVQPTEPAAARRRKALTLQEEKVRFAPDSLLEEAGFEPSVPRDTIRF
jgi:hypothetical protein